MKSPFMEEPVEEVPLTDSPLVRVIVQVQFPKLYDFEDDSVFPRLRAGFQERYPVTDVSKAAQITFDSHGVTRGPDQRVLQFSSVDGQWRISTTESFVCLDTGAYVSRSDLLDRMNEVLNIVIDELKPVMFARIGVRYINRFCDPNLREVLSKWIEPELHTGVSIPVGNATLIHSMSETLFSYDDNKLAARWGWLPAGAVPDQSVLPVDEQSWQLDIDTFAEGRFVCDVGATRQKIDSLAQSGHRFFRSVITQELLKDRGQL